MRSPENVLKSLSEKATDKTYRFERLYRNLYNPEFYLLAYQKIATSQGSMTAGADGLTLDGMSMERIGKLMRNCVTTHTSRTRQGVYILQRKTAVKSVRWAFRPRMTSYCRKLSA